MHFNKLIVEVSCILTSDIVLVDKPERFISVFLNLIILIDPFDSFFWMFPSSNTNILSLFETYPDLAKIVDVPWLEISVKILPSSLIKMFSYIPFIFFC